MSCQTCDTVLACTYGDDEQAVCASPLHCARCLDTAWTLSRLCEMHEKTAPPPKANGMTIERMLMRIRSHRQFSSLEPGVQQQLAQIGRFDRRRSTADNNYVRGVWHRLVEPQ
jgi:hypothetical protein